MDGAGPARDVEERSPGAGRCGPCSTARPTDAERPRDLEVPGPQTPRANAQTTMFTIFGARTMTLRIV